MYPPCGDGLQPVSEGELAEGGSCPAPAWDILMSVCPPRDESERNTESTNGENRMGAALGELPQLSDRSFISAELHVETFQAPTQAAAGSRISDWRISWEAEAVLTAGFVLCLGAELACMADEHLHLLLLGYFSSLPTDNLQSL